MTRFRTLVVEDTELIRRMLIQILSRSEFEVVGQAADGQEAVEKYTELFPDLVVMDLMMPGMDGIEAVREILKSDASACIVMCSAYGEKDVIAEAVEAGAVGFIQKPFMADNVLKTLRSVVHENESE